MGAARFVDAGFVDRRWRGTAVYRTELLLPAIQVVDRYDEPVACMVDGKSNGNRWGFSAAEKLVRGGVRFHWS